MASRFDDFFARAIEHEGKVCEDVPGDRGGPTKWGITLGRLADCRGVREPKRGTAAFESLKADLFALGESEIKDIYRKDYWDAVRADELPAGICYAVSDYSLNSGPSRAIKALQKLCGNPQTGRMDDETIREANAFQPVELIMLYCDERARFLNAIVESNPSQRKFLKGWLSRVGDVRRAAIKDAEGAPAREVTTAMPKAELGPEPTHAGTALTSGTVQAGAGGLATIGIAASDVLKDGLPEVTAQAQDLAGPIQSMMHLVKQHSSGIMLAVVGVLLVVMIVRHVRDKRELKALRGD